MSSRFETLTGEMEWGFPEYGEPPAEPMGLVRAWIASAEERGVREPRALALATADARGRASNRMVAVVEASEQGLVFSTHSTSRKGRQIAETGWASGVLYWREAARQLVLSGPVAPLPETESQRMWDSRPVPLHSMTAVSHQSDPLEDPARLGAEARRLGGRPLPRPERFVGYLLEPAEVEFWSADPERLHRRLRYDLTPHGWTTTRLQP
ncbi:phenazine biosynthesis FMN-dependent oxidase PhzG [Nocardiopsis sp. CNT312]|uniref:phenazine biosynthesis FMN-dependent oxidase PhzG n=1 Tax=Nocardiopsis sp. CNT312 TaxID=1137268 RepID=UPI00048BBECF|nr:phenazine biosynthesis FMN-dependent oxidase PhzG [Nocardiopsis sp. CNT312]